MATTGRTAREWASEAQAAISATLAAAQPAQAWAALQERDAEGQPRGALPYTEAAFPALANACSRDPEDINVVHHLAIAHHARAWDWELAGDPRAAQEWEHALNYWRLVASSGEFWERLKSQLLACAADADVFVLDKLRRDLLENLLDVHVDWVRHYCEGHEPARAGRHIALVQRARIPPAVKKRLVDKVFEAMTGGVPEARARHEYDSALTTLERFLVLFPEYLPALRQYAELCHEWLAGLSYLQHWNDILRLSTRAMPWAQRLAGHAELVAFPLARTALVDLAAEFWLRGDDCGDSYLAGSESGHNVVAQRDAARAAFEFGIAWGRLGGAHNPRASGINVSLSRSLNSLARCLHQEAREVQESEAAYRAQVSARLDLYRASVRLLEEATQCYPGHEVVEENLQVFREAVAKLASEQTFLDLFEQT